MKNPVFWIYGSGGVWHGMVSKNAKIGSKVHFHVLAKGGPVGLGVKIHLQFSTDIFEYYYCGLQNLKKSTSTLEYVKFIDV